MTPLRFIADGAKCQGHSDFIVYAHAKISHQLHSQNNFWSRLTFLNKHIIVSWGLRKAFWGNLVKIFDCRAFSLFETVPGCRAYSQTFQIVFVLKTWSVLYCIHVEKRGFWWSTDNSTFSHAKQTAFAWYWRVYYFFSLNAVLKSNKFKWLTELWTGTQKLWFTGFPLNNSKL